MVTIPSSDVFMLNIALHQKRLTVGVINPFVQNVIPHENTIRYDTIRYGTNVRLKVGRSQISLPHGTKKNKTIK